MVCCDSSDKRSRGRRVGEVREEGGTGQLGRRDLPDRVLAGENLTSPSLKDTNVPRYLFYHNCYWDSSLLLV